jgi:hypothetical protein
MGCLPFTCKRPPSARPTGRARVVASGTRTSTASITHSERTNLFSPSNADNTARAAQPRSGLVIVLVPDTHGKAAPHVSQLVAPIV